MLEVFRSNKLDVLAAMLVAQLGRPGALPEDPFQPLRVVVGSKGMERWLRHRLAAALPGHICANALFPFPQQVLADALRHHEGRAVGESEPDPWCAAVLPWVLLEVLPGLLAEPDPRGELAPPARLPGG
ncbi:MAG: exodeoxyribonuclease V subunit gamma [Pseudomonadota bacterium]